MWWCLTSLGLVSFPLQSTFSAKWLLLLVPEVKPARAYEMEVYYNLYLNWYKCFHTLLINYKHASLNSLLIYPIPDIVHEQRSIIIRVRAFVWENLPAPIVNGWLRFNLPKSAAISFCQVCWRTKSFTWSRLSTPRRFFGILLRAWVWL